MLERMARAMWQSHPNHTSWNADTLDAVPCLIYAKAALAALLVLDEWMVASGQDAGEQRGIILDNTDTRAIIQAAIKAAMEG